MGLMLISLKISKQTGTTGINGLGGRKHQYTVSFFGVHVRVFAINASEMCNKNKFGISEDNAHYKTKTNRGVQLSHPSQRRKCVKDSFPTPSHHQRKGRYNQQLLLLTRRFRREQGKKSLRRKCCRNVIFYPFTSSICVCMCFKGHIQGFYSTVTDFAKFLGQSTCIEKTNGNI